jgi:uncharacterized membrane protein YphA (DoxX/SURF4 family)
MRYQDILPVIGRSIFIFVFGIALFFKLMSPSDTAAYIAAAGFPAAGILTWLAILFEGALVICLLTGAYFREACIAAALYVLFLGFSFHGPGRWAGQPNEFGFFVDHFTFIAGLMFAAATGPGRWAIERTLLTK